MMSSETVLKMLTNRVLAAGSAREDAGFEQFQNTFSAQWGNSDA